MSAVRDALAARLNVILPVLGCGHVRAMPDDLRRVHAGHWQRSEGAFSWFLDCLGVEIGSQNTMSDCVRYPVTLSVSVTSWVLDPKHGDASPEDSDCAAVRQQRYIERLKAEIDNARKTNERLSAERTATEIADLRAQVAANGERTAELKRSFWRALLEGEEAVIHTEQAKRFLDRTKRTVPPKFRDDICELKAAHGYPRPRTSAECEAEEETKDE